MVVGNGKFGWLPADLRAGVHDLLDAPMPRGREALAFRQPLENLDRAEVGGKKHVIFLSYYPYLNSIKKSIALRRTGDYYTTFIACCAREDVQCLRWFDQVYELEHYRELLTLLPQASPLALSVHVQPSLLGALAVEALGGGRLVVDLYDSWHYMSRDQDTFNCRLEREVLSRADAVVHKMPDKGYEAIRQAWKLDTPGVQVHALPCREFFSCGESSDMPPYRLVYAGGVMPFHLALKNGHANQVFDPIIEGTGGELELTIYANQNARNMFWNEQGRYISMQDRLPHFSFQPGMPFYALPEGIKHFHYGLLYDNVELSTYRIEAFHTNMSTKIFSYFEAGLPILAYEEFHYIADLVREYGIGVIYSLRRLESLPKLLAEADYAALREGVARFRERFEVATAIPALKALYEGIEDIERFRGL
ncbi:MAG: hypothetical protein HY795_03555 [Desulfovibrio sp.]|nr:hypothetical protein [Desulfovibrio sp.]MBI4957963.1 hypothetical protein [Desulfovibrio sp.]